MIGKKQKSTRSRLITIIGILTAVCMVSTILLFVVPRRSGYLGTQTCVGVVTTPSFQVGVAWANPISSYLPPLLFSKYKVCVDLPIEWSTTRINGEWMLPPG